MELLHASEMTNHQRTKFQQNQAKWARVINDSINFPACFQAAPMILSFSELNALN